MKAMPPRERLSSTSPEVKRDGGAALDPHLLAHRLGRVEPSCRVRSVPHGQGGATLPEDETEVFSLGKLEVLKHQGQQLLPLRLLVEREPVGGVVKEDHGGGEVTEGGR